MKLTTGRMREDNHRDIFWQKSYVENDEGKILYKIVVCATQEFLSMALKRNMVDVRIDDDMKKWFNGKVEAQFARIKLLKAPDHTELVTDIYPVTDTMLQFARTVE